MKNLKTKIFTYNFDMSEKDEAEQYKRLCEKMKAAGIKCFETHGGGSHYLGLYFNGMIIELETKHIFDNQWNTAPILGKTDKGLRVFDWAQDYICNGRKTIKRGHYLEITQEMREIRSSTIECGYTGKQIPATEKPDHGFNLAALSSEYLKECDLHLIRFRPIGDKWKKSAEKLTDSEKDFLMPLYLEAQTTAKTERQKQKLISQQAEILRKYEKTIKDAKKELYGFQWLIDNNINLDNFIFYDHTQKFCYGWRSDGVSESVAAEMREKLKGFPAEIEIKEAGKK